MFPEGPRGAGSAGRGETRLEGTERPLPAPEGPRGPVRLPPPPAPLSGPRAEGQPRRPRRGTGFCRWALALRRLRAVGAEDRGVGPAAPPVAARSARAGRAGRAEDPEGGLAGGGTAREAGRARGASAPAQRARGAGSGRFAGAPVAGRPRVGMALPEPSPVGSLEPAEAAKPGPGSWNSPGSLPRGRAPLQTPVLRRLSRSRSWRAALACSGRARHVGAPGQGVEAKGAGCGHVEGGFLREGPLASSPPRPSLPFWSPPPANPAAGCHAARGGRRRRSALGTTAVCVRPPGTGSTQPLSPSRRPGDPRGPRPRATPRLGRGHTTDPAGRHWQLQRTEAPRPSRRRREKRLSRRRGPRDPAPRQPADPVSGGGPGACPEDAPRPPAP